ncbi:DUF475 domain-containing protein [Mesorhizobium carmichaelinearum]|uniref:DUF475 domain-containing protein n=1 Tax=Mesorhizobium carmichaelinearum TaxID=1208188 RepID=UPI000BA4A28D|nr:DUF475 domain-containing protein [Mesorhizobium carmichaelinearum]
MSLFLRYFWLALLVTAIGLLGSFWPGYSHEQSIQTGFRIFFITSILSVLEISLSFDNAIVNAKILKDMSPAWQRRFLTWGILIAVFGMRIVFPVAIVAIAASIGPVEAIRLAAGEPERYAQIMQDAHIGVAAFGGTFLLMVALSYFFDAEKDVHWLGPIEQMVAEKGTIVQGIEIGLVLALLVAFHYCLPQEDALTFLLAGVFGLLSFLAVHTFAEIMESRQQVMSAAAQGGFATFMYLEVLDASFSFDGVIGAFALSNNLFVIAIGLGIGAMYVRSMTIMLVELGTLASYRYLENGAFWAVLFLAVVMYFQTIFHIPEVVTGGFGVVLIGLSLWSSVRWNRVNRDIFHDGPQVIEEADGKRITVSDRTVLLPHD